MNGGEMTDQRNGEGEEGKGACSIVRGQDPGKRVSLRSLNLGIGHLVEGWIRVDTREALTQPEKRKGYELNRDSAARWLHLQHI
jgi:hypothetical protein